MIRSHGEPWLEGWTRWDGVAAARYLKSAPWLEGSWLESNCDNLLPFRATTKTCSMYFILSHHTITPYCCLDMCSYPAGAHHRDGKRPLGYPSERKPKSLRERRCSASIRIMLTYFVCIAKPNCDEDKTIHRRLRFASSYRLKRPLTRNPKSAIHVYMLFIDGCAPSHSHTRTV